MSTSQEFRKKLESLAQLDIDAVHAYTAAIERISLSEVKDQLTQFRGDHERHISNLTPLIVRLGGKTPTGNPDFKGYLIQGFTAIRSMMSNEQALKAMRGNEELTNRTYAEALELEFPEEIRQVVQLNRNDERRHLEYINKCIEEKVWEMSDWNAA